MKKNKGFTLIELLVVISIIALLVAILMPALGKAKKQAQNAVCQSNMKTYGLVISMYLQENEGAFPDSYYTIFTPAQRGEIGNPNLTGIARWKKQKGRLIFPRGP
ncbi:MAG: type II secretion system GspH family protein [Phycisphaerae bacterium]|nr:type II secretion system GspH family protein [Phycisphaerae bacterium]